MSALLVGIAAAVGAYFVVWRYKKRIRRAAPDGSMRFGPSLLGFGMMLMMLAPLFGALLFFVDQDQQRYGLLGALALSLAAGIYFCGEAVRTRGVVDQSGILFESLWGGRRSELWRDLRGAKYSALSRCYVLTFKSGKKIRISVFLNGHGAVLEALRARGHVL